MSNPVQQRANAIRAKTQQKYSGMQKKASSEQEKVRGQITAQREKDFSTLKSGMDGAKPTATPDDIQKKMQGEFDAQKSNKQKQLDTVQNKFSQQEVKLFKQKDARGFEDAARVEKDTVPEPPDIQSMISKGVIGLFKG
jgi:adenine-specific DNA glycosylase